MHVNVCALYAYLPRSLLVCLYAYGYPGYVCLYKEKSRYYLFSGASVAYTRRDSDIDTSTSREKPLSNSVQALKSVCRYTGAASPRHHSSTRCSTTMLFRRQFADDSVPTCWCTCGSAKTAKRPPLCCWCASSSSCCYQLTVGAVLLLDGKAPITSRSDLRALCSTSA